MLKRNGQVYTQAAKNCSANELLPILSSFAGLESSTIYSDTWKSYYGKAYDGLVVFFATLGLQLCKKVLKHITV